MVTRIEQELESISPDQVKVIHEMALNRGLCPDKLTSKQYRKLIEEEAWWAVNCCGDDKEERKEAISYAAKLLRISEAI